MSSIFRNVFFLLFFLIAIHSSDASTNEEMKVEIEASTPHRTTSTAHRTTSTAHRTTSTAHRTTSTAHRTTYPPVNVSIVPSSPECWNPLLRLTCFASIFILPNNYDWIDENSEVISHGQILIVPRPGVYTCVAYIDAGGTNQSANASVDISRSCPLFCNSQPCRNGGTCDKPSSSCICTPGFTGPFCQTLTERTTTFSPTTASPTTPPYRPKSVYIIPSSPKCWYPLLLVTCFTSTFNRLVDYVWIDGNSNAIIRHGQRLFVPCPGVYTCVAYINAGGTNQSANASVDISTSCFRTTASLPTTTQPPAVAPCNDPTGTWVSASPISAQMCVSIDPSNNGLLTGVFKNYTDTYHIEVVGRTTIDIFDQIGFTGYWPLTVGISSFVGDCHNFYGKETIMLNGIQGNKGTSDYRVSGQLQSTNSYTFYRTTGSCLQNDTLA